MEEPRHRLQKARASAGFKSPAEAARQIASINQNTLTSHENGNRPISKKSATNYADVFDIDAGWLLFGDEGNSTSIEIPLVKLAGKVGAGSEINLLNNDDLGMVEAPPNADHNSIAVKVTGDSMFPAYEDGELLYYSSNGSPENFVNRRCVVKLGDGRIFVKTLRPGSTPALWNLESLNTQFPTMTDQTVEWVAKIDWVKPR